MPSSSSILERFPKNIPTVRKTFFFFRCDVRINRRENVNIPLMFRRIFPRTCSCRPRKYSRTRKIYDAKDGSVGYSFYLQQPTEKSIDCRRERRRESADAAACSSQPQHPKLRLHAREHPSPVHHKILYCSTSEEELLIPHVKH